MFRRTRFERKAEGRGYQYTLPLRIRPWLYKYLKLTVVSSLLVVRRVTTGEHGGVVSIFFFFLLGRVVFHKRVCFLACFALGRLLTATLVCMVVCCLLLATASLTAPHQLALLRRTVY